MALLKAEQIAAAVLGVLQAAIVAPAANTIDRARAYSYHDESLPALNVVLGPDKPVTDKGPDNLEFQDWELTVFVDIVVKTSAVPIDTLLNSLRLAVHKAIMANYTLGLPFVFNGYPGEAAEPEIKGDGELPVAVLRTAFVFNYRASITDPSN